MTPRGVDLDAWVRARLGVRNAAGGRGYEQGVRAVDCPLCGDRRARGWVHVGKGTVGCFDADCLLHSDRMRLLEYVRLVEGLPTRWHALAYLRLEFPAIGPALAPAIPRQWTDWCRFPAEFRPFVAGPRPAQAQAEALRFLGAQWGLTAELAVARRMGYCTAGRLAWRAVVPILMGGVAVGWQARSFRGGEPKYLTSEHGDAGDPAADCGRPKSAMLYNLDAVTEGCHAVVVEGIGDAVGYDARRGSGAWEKLDRGAGGAERYIGVRAGGDADDVAAGCAPFRRGVPVAILGSQLSDDQAALIAAQAPGRVTVALDPDAEGASRAAARALQAWGLAVEAATWEGGKDAGSGARLSRLPEPLLRRVGW